MRKTAYFCALGLVFCGAMMLNAQETERPLCNPDEDTCVDDIIRIKFDDNTGADKSVWALEAYEENKEIKITVYNDTKTTGVQGWSYGVAHDMEALSLPTDGATLEETDAKALMDTGFDATSADQIQTCLTEKCDKDPAKNERSDGGGWITAVVLSLIKKVELPVEEQSIAKAKYTLIKDVGSAGTMLTISRDLAKKGSPRVEPNVTVGGKSRVWTTAQDGKLTIGPVTGPKPVENLACAKDAAEDKAVLTWTIPAGETYDSITVLQNGTAIDPPVAADATGYTSGVLEPGTYDYIVRPASGGEDAPDATCSVTIPEAGAPKPVENLTCALDGTQKKAVLTWAIPAGETYDSIEVKQNGTAISPPVAADATGYTSPDLAPGKYDYIVTPKKGAQTAEPKTCSVTIPGPVECPTDDYALYFGGTATSEKVVLPASATEYPISSRNKEEALGFQGGVKITTSGQTKTWAFNDGLGTDVNRLIDCLITDSAGDSQVPVKGNQADSPADKEVGSIVRGAAVASFAGDFFEYDLDPGVGGPGFFFGYVADLEGKTGNKIPAKTGDGDPCPINELLIVKFGAPPTQFSRGDADGNGKINVSDAVLIIQNIVGNLPKRFDCDKMLDANDDGTLNVTDAIPVLEWVFRKGPPLAAPFRTCGEDGTPSDTLTCPEPNC